MNIIEKLNENNVSYDVQYFGMQDLSTGWVLKDTIENYKLFLQYYKENKIRDILTMDNYIDYLVLKKVIQMKEIIPYITTDENKQIFKNIINTLEPFYNDIETGSIIKFISNNIDEIFQLRKEVHFINDITVEFCIEYPEIFINVYDYLIDNYSYLIFDNFDRLQKVLIKNNLFEKLLSTEVINKCINYRLEKIADIIISCKKEVQKYTNDAVDIIIKFGEKIASEINIETVGQNRNTINTIFIMLKKIKNIKAVQFEKYLDTADKLLNEYLEKNGKSFKYDIPVGEIIKQLKSDLDWRLKMLHITHDLHEHDDKMISTFDTVSNENDALMDLVSTNIPTNENFPLSKQQHLRIIITVGSVTILEMLKDEYLFDRSCTWYPSFLNYISDKLEYTENDLQDDITLLFQMLKNIFYNSNKSNEVIQSLCYGACMFICALTEKLLRITNKYIRQKEEYVSIDGPTMGSLLSDNNNVIKEILGEQQLKCMRYFFCTDGEERVGQNLRNKLAHWNGLNCSNLNTIFVCQLFYLFTSVLNSMFYYFYEKDRTQQ